jgi:ABC-type oligopeptide transport system substrate-binding subunit
MNRPDAGPQPRHAIERDGDAWTESGGQVVSGPFAVEERTGDTVRLRRRADYQGHRSGNVAEVELYRADISASLPRYEREETDMVLVRYTPRLADLMPDAARPDASLGAAAWSAYVRFDHRNPVTGNIHLRRALAHAVDREALATAKAANLVVATGGVVPPALQGHTPEIALRYDPDLAREHLARSGFAGRLELAGATAWEPILRVIADSWQEAFGDRLDVGWWTWLDDEIGTPRVEAAPLRLTGWLPGYADPEYYLRLLFQSTSRTNEGGFADPVFDELIERARQERSDRGRLERFHEADRYAIADRVAVIPLVYGRSTAFVHPHVRGWWEFGKTSASFADLTVGPVR